MSPHSLLLDGQQRMTSLYQVSLRGQVVETVTPKKKKVKRWFYIDIRKALDLSIDREEAIVGVPEVIMCWAQKLNVFGVGKNVWMARKFRCLPRFLGAITI
jgi:hypothetical protein